MKVQSMWSSGRRPHLGLLVATAVALAVVVGAGFVPSVSAWARVAGQGGADALVLTPVAVPDKAQEILEPSGLQAVAAQPAAPRIPSRVSPRYQPSRVSAVADGAWRSARASTYGIGDGFVGKGMADGGILQDDSMVVAHKSLPFGTLVEFSYNGMTCIAEVRDRGPYIAGREFDLGPGTANALGFDGVHSLQYRIVN